MLTYGKEVKMRNFDSYEDFEKYARSIWPGFERYLNSLKRTINKENFAKAKESILLLAEMVKKHDKAAKFSASEDDFKLGHFGVEIRAKQIILDDMESLKKALECIENIGIDPLINGKVEIGILYPNVFTYTRPSK